MPGALTATFVKNLTEADAFGGDTSRRSRVYGDGPGGYGLTLRVHRTTDGRITKRWIQRLRIDHRLTNVALGSYPVVTLREARDRAFANRRAVEFGTDPRTPPVPTFAEATEAKIAADSPQWRNPDKTAAVWRAAVHTYAANLLPMRVDKITTRDVSQAIEPIWLAKHNTASKLRRRLSQTFRWCMVQGYRLDDPAGDALLDGLPKNAGNGGHMRSLPPAELPAALDVIAVCDAHPTARLALTFLALTATRSQETCGARWDEIDGDTWTIPGDRTKTGRPFRVPLSPAALAVVDDAKAISTHPELVFPSPQRKVYANQLNRVCKRLGLNMSPHGFRSSFRVWAAETGEDYEVSEMVLSHRVGNSTVNAYQRSDLFKRRHEVMDRWSQYLIPSK
ncbi:MAG: tyrosine-type recombinase/integrase [Gammaproteobacteria bacterium]|nr:tyrosine-type recombinase/integrase [Gammaproteobacteria bacterium]